VEQTYARCHETDVADLFRQHFRREVRQGQYVLPFARSGEDALRLLAEGVEPQLIVILSDSPICQSSW
jgi:two-component system, response regulator, stage 0 sporulation protein F